MSIEGCQRRRSGMAEGVVGADGDNRQLWPSAVQQPAEAGVIAAVMGNLEHIDGTWVQRGCFRLGVGGQQHREAAPVGDQNDGKAVWIFVAMGAAQQLGRRPENVEPQSAGAELATRGDALGGNPCRRGLGKHLPTEHSVEQLSDRHRSQQFLDSTRMIRLVVGDNRRAKPVHAGCVALFWNTEIFKKAGIASPPSSATAF